MDPPVILQLLAYRPNGEPVTIRFLSLLSLIIVFLAFTLFPVLQNQLFLLSIATCFVKTERRIEALFTYRPRSHQVSKSSQHREEKASSRSGNRNTYET